MPQPPARAFSQKDLPPSVESAYYRKCIDLRRRITDIEDSNDGTRLRITRLNRGIQKMRLERAFLLEQINKHMEYNADDSDRSSSPPPTPTDKPLRSKRSGGGGSGGGLAGTSRTEAGATSTRKATPPLQTGPITGLGSVQQNANQSPENGAATTQPQHQQSTLHAMNPMSSAQSTPDPSRQSQSTNYFPPAAASPNAAVNGAPVLPPLHSLPALQATTPRPYFDPAYDEQRAVPSASAEEGETGRRRAYSGAQATPTATAGDAAVQNGDTEMTDVGFTAVNR
ncbi:hypothetical protein T440DRAFT_471837 [Plenodomus tracheiphilus IPT5]|uniref:INO80 complex subunit F domain-containing protein n=1 Tax=Plenodomus tracheiphilus IPT5 TaxID=1408161 RepID=A0A6A7AVJ9_9PLEO|nr:hypothetical protein T440DRAFT_471837 [Plenodomus tracheiphilus IPT5]